MGEDVEGHGDGGRSGNLRQAGSEENRADDSERKRAILSNHQDEAGKEDEGEQAFGEVGDHPDDCQEEEEFYEDLRGLAVHRLSLRPGHRSPKIRPSLGPKDGYTAGRAKES